MTPVIVSPAPAVPRTSVGKSSVENAESAGPAMPMPDVPIARNSQSGGPPTTKNAAVNERAEEDPLDRDRAPSSVSAQLAAEVRGDERRERSASRRGR